VLENVNLAARKPLDEMKLLSAGTDRVKKALGDDGRVLIRWSGTEAKLRIMLEGPNEDHLHIWANELAEAAKKDTRKDT
jgi:phosphoglucosamine mutase